MSPSQTSVYALSFIVVVAAFLFAWYLLLLGKEA